MALQTCDEAGKRSACSHRARHIVEGDVNLGDRLGAATHREAVGATLRQEVEVTELGSEGGDDVLVVLTTVAGAIQVAQGHPAGDRVTEHVVEGQALLATDDPDRAEPEKPTSGGDGVDVVGVRPAEGEDDVVASAASCRQVWGELAPLIAGDRRMDQIVAFDQ